MAQRRMFSLKIVSSDAFLDMPTSSRELYFQLGMYADDDGFVNPKKIVRMIGASDDDIKVLIGKRFLLPFENGVVVIKHWLINNLIRKDFYQETIYLDQKKILEVKENKAYTDCKQNVNNLDTQYRLGKDSIGKDNNTDEQGSSAMIPLVIEMFISINPACKNFYGNKTQRKACSDLIDAYGFEEVKNCIANVLPRTNGADYFPTITTPVQLRDKWVSLKSAVAKKKNKVTDIIT